MSAELLKKLQDNSSACCNCVLECVVHRHHCSSSPQVCCCCRWLDQSCLRKPSLCPKSWSRSLGKVLKVMPKPCCMINVMSQKLSRPIVTVFLLGATTAHLTDTGCATACRCKLSGSMCLTMHAEEFDVMQAACGTTRQQCCCPFSDVCYDVMQSKEMSSDDSYLKLGVNLCKA